MRIPPLAGTVLAIALLVGCGSGEPARVSTTTTTAVTNDWTLVESLPLRATDLPAGFAAVPATDAPAMVDVRDCITPLRLTSATKVGETFLRGTNAVAAQSSLVRNPADTTAIVEAFSDPAVQACISPLLQQQLLTAMKGAGLEHDELLSSPVTGLGPLAAGMRASASTDDGSTVRTVAASDVLVAASGRSVTLLFLTWLDGPPPPDFVTSVMTASRARATAALTS